MLRLGKREIFDFLIFLIADEHYLGEFRFHVNDFIPFP